MGHDATTLHELVAFAEQLPAGARILELGEQDVVDDVDLADIQTALMTIHKDSVIAAQRLAAWCARPLPRKVSTVFAGSRHHYQCIDLFPGEFTLALDLNEHLVPDEHRGTFDIITNHGTTEHIGDQMNAFRAIHDYAKLGALMVHYVPFGGFFNHGLYNYHPLFFVFLAHTNEYEIVKLRLLPPHLPHSIPEVEGLSGAAEWAGMRIDSGIIICILRKTRDAAFRKVTDFDATRMGHRPLPSPWREIVADRYDLRVRNKK
jgi:hypothetical protein